MRFQLVEGTFTAAKFIEFCKRLLHDATAPVRHGPFEYFTRTRAGLQYPIHCRRPAGTPGLPDPEIGLRYVDTDLPAISGQDATVVLSLGLRF